MSVLVATFLKSTELADLILYHTDFVYRLKEENKLFSFFFLLPSGFLFLNEPVTELK